MSKRRPHWKDYRETHSPAPIDEMLGESAPAPSVPTSPPAGPAVSPDIDALIDEYDASLKVRSERRVGWADRVRAARAALREAFRKQEADRDADHQELYRLCQIIEAREAEVARLTKERDDEVLVSSRRLEYIERLEAESCRLQQEALTPEETCFLAGIGEPKDHTFAWGCFCVKCEDLRPKLKRIALRRGSAHKEKEWARSSDISPPEK